MHVVYEFVRVLLLALSAIRTSEKAASCALVSTSDICHSQASAETATGRQQREDDEESQSTTINRLSLSF